MSSKILDTRTRILEQAWRLMEKRRGSGVSIQSIARAAGVSRQAVYLHFKSRAELLVATVRYADEKNNIAARLRKLYAAGSGREALNAYVEFWGNYIPEIHGLARALLRARETDPDAAEAWEDRMKVMRDGCLQVVNILVQEGNLAPQWSAKAASETMWAMFSISVWESLTIDLGCPKSEYVSRMQIALGGAFVKKL
jgi:AcrR family transcriptional regulator